MFARIGHRPVAIVDQTRANSRRSWAETHMRGNFDRTRPMCAWSRPNFGQLRPNSARVRPEIRCGPEPEPISRLNSALEFDSSFDQSWPGIDRSWADVGHIEAQAQPITAKIGRESADIDPEQVKFGPSPTTSSPNLANADQMWTWIGEFGRSSSKLGRIRPNSAKFGPASAKVGPGIDETLARFRPISAESHGATVFCMLCQPVAGARARPQVATVVRRRHFDSTAM